LDLQWSGHLADTLRKHYEGTFMTMENVVSFGRIPVSFLDAAKNRGLNRDIVTGLVDTAPIGWLDGTSEADLLEDLPLRLDGCCAGEWTVGVCNEGKSSINIAIFALTVSRQTD
jgi:hypothetical protein